MAGGSPSQIPNAPQPLRTRHTPSSARLLDSLAASLLVTNYQTGNVVVIWAGRELSRP
jgi:hypothetical protein